MEMTLRLAPHCIVKRSQVLALSSSDVFQVLLQAPVRSSTGAAFKHLANALYRTVLNLWLSLFFACFCCCRKHASSARKLFLSELKWFLSELKRASSVCKRFIFARRQTASSFKCANCFFFFFTKIDRVMLTHRAHPLRSNRIACFITKIFELELQKK